MSETGSPTPPDDALMDLAIKQAVEGLSPDEQRALDAMNEPSKAQALRGLEQAAAAITLAAAPVAGPLPAALRARLDRAADSYLASQGAAGAATAGGRAANAPANRSPAAGTPAAGTPTAGPRSASPRRGGAGLAWFAAAACLLLAVFAWLRPFTPPAQVATAPSPVAPLVPAPPAPATPPPAAPPTPQEERLALLARAGTLKIALSPTKDPGAAGVTGDAVWDPVAQKGFLHFVGLVANDPAVRQYQIWIFDGTRDKRYPVDGGVFDVPANTPDVVIPIRADLPIRQAKAFAVTAEQPGGVVVSGLKHVLVLGSAG